MAIEVERRKSDVGADVRKCREAGYEEAIVIHTKEAEVLGKHNLVLPTSNSCIRGSRHTVSKFPDFLVDFCILKNLIRALFFCKSFRFG